MNIITDGDILTSGTEALVNPINCHGVMGNGLEARIREHFPENFAVYADACRRRQMIPGQVLAVEIPWYRMPRYIINFPIQRHWNDLSRKEDIESGLNHLVQVIENRQITSVALPALGCERGGLSWEEVESLLRKTLGRLKDVRILVYAPQKQAEKTSFYRYLMGI